MRQEILTMNGLNPDMYTIILFGVLLITAIGLIIVGRWLYKYQISSKKQKRIDHFVSTGEEDALEFQEKDTKSEISKDIGKLRKWINKSLGSLSSEKLQMKLSSAYWPVTDTEYILLRIFGTGLAFVLGWFVLDNFLVGIFLAAIAIMLPTILLDRSIARRQKKFQEQLLDILILIQGAVKSGYGLMQALDLAVKEIPAPASEEFGRVLREVRLGYTLERALLNLSDRMENDDLQIVVTAIIINAQVGGNLSTVLEATISTIRDRMHLQGEVRALTSYARYVGNFLTMMPFLAGLIIFLINRTYFDSLRTSLLTQVLFIGALFGVFIGNLWLRRIAQIKV
jgi:tight adherence protein B